MPAAFEPTPSAMRAVIQRGYGGPDVIRVESRPVPKPEAGEILVRIRAAAIARGDALMMLGKPYLIRLMFGLRRPKRERIGHELAGEVAAVGTGVQGFAIGDRVFGQHEWGAFSEYHRVPADLLAPLPDGISFVQGATTSDSAQTALQGLRDGGKLQAGQRVLIIGASGGVGTFAVQIAKTLGAEVIAVCSTRHVDLMGQLGAEEVIDYSRQDFAEVLGDRPVDVILDLVGNRHLEDLRRVLRPAGRLVACSGGLDGDWLGPIRWMLRLRRANRRWSQTAQTFLVKPNGTDQRRLAGMLADGGIQPVIQQVLPLEEAPAALEHVAIGRSQGKTVLDLGL